MKILKTAKYEFKYEDDDFKYETHGDPSVCESCGGKMTWCTTCRVWSKKCCEEYGSCMCS